MLSVLIGIALILLIASVTVALGALTRLLAARIIAPRPRSHGLLTPLDRIALGNETIARDLQPDDLRPIARTAERRTGSSWADGSIWADAPSFRGAAPSEDLAVRYPGIAAHALR
ncbi:hypothetical protein ACT3SP_01135 [Brachybacterium sp. AOP43-C2-M15]|uniref:hypothetical protein n=1 Tax=Brachybacterium sp. AOP43-C2-M15 TaxID=3457661 RepID=UPI0040345F81